MIQLRSQLKLTVEGLCSCVLKTKKHEYTTKIIWKTKAR